MKWPEAIVKSIESISIAVVLIAVTQCCQHAKADSLMMVKEEVYRISTKDRGVGSGFAIKTPSGKIMMITNWHVCQDAEKGVLYASHENKPDFKIPLTIIHVDSKRDLCILGFKGKGLKPAANYTIGEKVFSVGHPHAQIRQVLVKGMIVTKSDITLLYPGNEAGCPSDMTKIEDFQRHYPLCQGAVTVIDTTLPSVPGCSGSPVLDYNGEVVGVINSTWKDDKGTMFGSMIPLETVKEFLESYEKNNTN